MKYLKNEVLRKHTSFKIGGLAKYFCVPKSLEDLKAALVFAKEQKIPIAIMGAGTNLLALDRGFNGLVIKFAGGLQTVNVEDELIYIGAGMLLPRLVKFISTQGFSSLGFLAGIPGTLGGAVVMNAGAWGNDLGSYVYQVKVLDKQGKEKVFNKKELKFGYRKSLLQKSRFIVYEVVLALKKEKKKTIQQAELLDYAARRKKTQPLGSPNCGSVFKNPNHTPAGKLIEAAGCKGMRCGDAQVSMKHANFIVNLGEAKSKDVLKLITNVQKAVYNRFKIKLEPEMKVMVEF